VCACAFLGGFACSHASSGKRDKNNDPHVGGNTWAGGTGGRDTAGLGGKGGPYRMVRVQAQGSIVHRSIRPCCVRCSVFRSYGLQDAGHDVHQLSQEEKDAVPDHIKQAAREMVCVCVCVCVCMYVSFNLVRGLLYVFEFHAEVLFSFAARVALLTALVRASKRFLSACERST
jgi:hypothetical protein